MCARKWIFDLDAIMKNHFHDTVTHIRFSTCPVARSISTSSASGSVCGGSGYGIMWCSASGSVCGGIVVVVDIVSCGVVKGKKG